MPASQTGTQLPTRSERDWGIGKHKGAGAAGETSKADPPTLPDAAARTQPEHRGTHNQTPFGASGQTVVAAGAGASDEAGAQMGDLPPRLPHSHHPRSAPAPGAVCHSPPCSAQCRPPLTPSSQSKGERPAITPFFRCETETENGLECSHTLPFTEGESWD